MTYSPNYWQTALNWLGELHVGDNESNFEGNKSKDILIKSGNSAHIQPSLGF